MSPLDEIRWLNRKAARGERLSPYQRWVLKGCRGPCPTRRTCAQTKAWLKKEIARRQRELAWLESDVKRAQQALTRAREDLREAKHEYAATLCEAKKRGVPVAKPKPKPKAKRR